MPRKRTVGIVGAGNIVTSGHLPVLLAMDEVEVVWLTDADARKGARVARNYKVPWLPLPSPLSALPPADVVLLAIPFGVRAPFYEVLAGRGTAVYVEKPFARTLAQHREICAAFPPWRLACGFQRRSSGGIELARSVVGSRLFGPLRWLRFELGARGRIRSGSHQSSLEHAGGGLLFEVGIHGVDALLFLTSARGGCVRSATMLFEQGFDIHTEAEIVLDVPGQDAVTAGILVTCLSDTRERIDCGFEFATVSFSLFSGGEMCVRPACGGCPEYTLAPPADAPPMARTVSQILFRHWRAFLDGLTSQVPNRTSAAATALTTAVIGELYEVGSRAAAVPAGHF